MGMLEIQLLRSKAQAALGDDVDLPGFHYLLSLDGAMPMAILGERVDAWIAEQQSCQGSPGC